MSKSKYNEGPGFLAYVYELNQGRNLSEALDISLKDIQNIDLALLKRIGLRTYAENKWSINNLFQHLIDWERIWCFRAIIFARSEGTIPVAHDQEVMAANSNADDLPIEQLVEELRLVRQATIAMFESFDQGLLDTPCRFFEYEMSIREIGLTVTAHQIHHFNVIKEKYAPLVED